MMKIIEAKQRIYQTRELRIAENNAIFPFLFKLRGLRSKLQLSSEVDFVAFRRFSKRKTSTRFNTVRDTSEPRIPIPFKV